MNKINKTTSFWARAVLAGLAILMVIPGPAAAQTRVDPFDLRVAADLVPAIAEAERFQADLPRYVASYRDAAGIATDFIETEVMIRPDSDADMAGFLARYNGVVVRDDRVPRPPEHILEELYGGIWDPDGPVARPTTFTVRVDLNAVPATYLHPDGNIIGMDGPYEFSSANGARLLALVRHERLAGIEIMPNFVLLPFYGQLLNSIEGNGIDMFGLSVFNRALPGNLNRSSVVIAWQLLLSHNGYNRNVKVAIIDGGFYIDGNGLPIVGPSGTDYPLNIVNNQYDFIDEDFNAGGLSTFGGWHGNGVAGIATGLLGNGGGSAGTGAQVSDPYLFKRGITQDFTYKAVKTARAWGMDVINMSYGAACNPDCVEYDLPRNEIAGAVADGIVVVAAAGNASSNSDIFAIQPCTLPGVICVGALDTSVNTSVNYSNFGPSVDIWAPTNITVMADGSSPNSTRTFSGTSASSPFIAGIAAMMKSVNPSLTSNQVRGILRGTGWQDSPDPRVTHYVDAEKAVREAMGFDLPPDSVDPTSSLNPFPIATGVPYNQYRIHKGGQIGNDFFSFQVNDYFKYVMDLDYMRGGLGSMNHQIVGQDNDPWKAPQGVDQILTFTGADHRASLLVPGSYRVKLSSPNPQHYHMKVDLEPAELDPDQFEENDTFLTAKAPGSGTFDVNLHVPTDVDHYLIIVPQTLKYLLGGFFKFELIDADRPIIMELYPANGGGPPLDSFIGETGVFNPGGGNFTVKAHGPRNRYRFRVRSGWDKEALLSFIEEFYWFLDPLGPVVFPVEIEPQFLAARAGDVESGNLLLTGRGLQMTVFDLQNNVLAQGMPANLFFNEEDKQFRSAFMKDSNVQWASIAGSGLAPDDTVLIMVERIAAAPGNGNATIHIIRGGPGQ